MLLLDTLLFIIILLYVLQAGFIFWGTHRLNYPRIHHLPPVSILVALRNEAENLIPCLTSLIEVDYPPELLEIVLVNDRSRDATPQIIEEFKLRSSRIKTVHIKKGIPGLSGKANAIAQGMEHCKGDIILITDGDCQVPRTWVKAHVSYYEPQVGMVGGFTLLDRKADATPLFGKIQSLDWSYLLTIGTGAMGFGIPLSVLGNNLSFRRCAYEEVGGYQNMGFTIIEDFALMKTLLRKTSWKVRYPIDPQMLVYSLPMDRLSRFYEQRKRWSAGGKEMVLYGKFLMLLACLAHIFLPLSFFILNHIFLSVSGFLILGLTDFILLYRTTGLINRRDLLKYFPLWEIFYFVYTIVFAPALLFPIRVTWKNIAYSWKFNWKLKKLEELVH
ncbi:MAG: glycosyltransferase [Calditrichaeota bacterium]|nr:MAG: glycosyltransferase [Calditrichota bacterium]